MNSAWTIEVDGDSIAWLTFDLAGEKVNKFNAAALKELDEVLDRVRDDGSICGLVVVSGKRDSFIVGADIDELARLSGPDDAGEKARAGLKVFEKLAALRVPTLALVHGACLGGGLEMALACRYRLVTDHPKTSLGLPEVNLGIIPGWGGTQRLPRLIGLPAALKMILTGKPVDGRRAIRSGLADGIAAAPFAREAARKLLVNVLTRQGQREVLRRRRRRRSLATRLLTASTPGRALIYRRARKEIMERTKGHYPAPLEALEVVRRTYRRRGGAEGAAIETEAFAELAVTTISRNLVWLFQAGQRFRKSGGDLAGGEPARAVERAAVIGAGIMGSGIAWSLARAGIGVRMRDVSWDALARGMGAAAASCRALVKRRRMTESEMSLVMHRIAPAIDYAGFAEAAFVIEAVAEDLDIKRQVLQEIEANTGPGTIICTNTSSLPLEELATALKNPQRFLGLHFFNPVPRMPLVEVIPGPGTAPEAVVAVTALVRQMDKTPMVVGACAGFLVNRILLPYLIESAWMFEEGVDVRRIDALLERFGMPMGPLALVDEVGLDVGYKVAKVLEGAYGPRMHVPEALGAVASDKCLGRKTGAGFYRYRNGHKKPNPRVQRLARQARRQDGVSSRALTDEQIVDRAVLIMVNEAARCLEEGVIDRPESLDMAMIMGTGFAPFRGGLLRYADERGVREIRDRLQELAGQFGERFKVAPLIEKMAGEGGRFYQEAPDAAA